MIELSVIIPVYNDQNGIKITLNSLINQTFPNSKYEIIVVDNNSKDETKEVIKSFSKKHKDLIKVYNEDNIQSSYAARNKGVSNAVGNFFCFIDSDMVVESDYLENIFNHFCEEDVDYIGCKVNIFSNKMTLSAKYDLINGFPVKSYIVKLHFAPTCCLSIRKNVYNKVGGFDNRLESGGDMVFGQLAFALGFSQKYIDDIVINHPARWKYLSLISKTRRISRGIVQLNAYYPLKYNHLVKKYFKIKRYLPKNPIKGYRIFKQSGINITHLGNIFFSFFHIPFRIVGLIELIKQYLKIKLKRVN